MKLFLLDEREGNRKAVGNAVLCIGNQLRIRFLDTFPNDLIAVHIKVIVTWGIGDCPINCHHKNGIGMTNFPFAFFCGVESVTDRLVLFDT